MKSRIEEDKWAQVARRPPKTRDQCLSFECALFARAHIREVARHYIEDNASVRRSNDRVISSRILPGRPYKMCSVLDS